MAFIAQIEQLKQGAYFIARFIVDAVFPPRETALLARSVSLTALGALLQPELLQVVTGTSTGGESSSPLYVTTLLPYREPLVQALIIEAKYENNRRAQELLGILLAAYIESRSHLDIYQGETLMEASIILIPVPLSQKRRKSRGYNQVEEVARFAQRSASQDITRSAHLNAPFTVLPHALIRTRDTAPQTSLGQDARRSNMTGAFGAGPSLDSIFSENGGSPDSPHTFILLDDVLTTGATLAAAYTALQQSARDAFQNTNEKYSVQATANNIIVLALAH
jgi:predicted amidophosphoribosyltransferase